MKKRFRNHSSAFILILLFFYINPSIIQSQNNNLEKLTNDVVTIYKNSGEIGLRKYIETHKGILNSKLIIQLAEDGYQQSREIWLNIAMILANKLKDQQTIADVYLDYANYNITIGNDPNEYLNKALEIYLILKDDIGQGNVYLSQGNLFVITGENQKALEVYSKALPYFEKANDPLGQGNIYQSKGDIYFNIGDNQKALDMYSKALLYYEKANEPHGQGNVYKSQGDVFSRIGENRNALEMYSKALLYFEKTNSLIGQGDVYQSQGDVFSNTGDNQKALEMYSKALSYFEKTDSPIGQGNVYQSQGEIYSRIGENQSAFKMYSKALQYFEKANSPIGQGGVYKSQGDIYSRIGQNQSALEMYSKALLYFEKANDPVGLGNVYQSQGEIYLMTGNNQKALEMYSKALPYFEKANEPRGQGNVYQSQGEIFSRIGDNQKALEMYSKALQYFERANDPLGQGNIYQCQGDIYLTGDYQIGQGNVNSNQSDVYLRKSADQRGIKILSNTLPNYEKANYPRALEMYSKALPYFEKANDLVGLGNVYQSQAEIYSRIGDNQKALELYSKALPYFEKANDTVGLGNVYQGQGDVFSNTDDNQKALEMYSKALSYFEKANVDENIANTLLSKAYVNNKIQNIEKAYELYIEGINKLDKVRMRIGFNEMKMNFQERTEYYNNEAIRFMFMNKFYEKAFEFTERTKARTFLDQIVEKKVIGVEKGLNVDLKKKRDGLIIKISFIQSQLTKKNDDKKIEELKTKYKLLDEEYEKLKQQIRFQNPLYSAVNYPMPVTIDELQKQILKSDEALIQFYFTEDSVFVFIVTDNLYKVVKLNSDQNEIEEEANDFYKNVLTPKKYPSSSSLLYPKIIQPLNEYIGKKKILIIVPDGVLSYIPFEAIYIKKGEKIKYLMEDYTIKYIQSGTMLSLLRKELEKNKGNNRFIGFGDPVYDYENYVAHRPEKGEYKNKKGGEENLVASLNRNNYNRAGGTLNRLEGSGEEVEEVSKIFGQESKKCLRIEATEENVKSSVLKNYGYILLSCHGLLSDEFQSLVLSQIPNSKEDGYLTLNEIMNLDWYANLVVLSACQTGMGKVKKGEGVVGLTRAIMYAGTPAAVVSLWSVSDEGTKELMTRFFRNIVEKKLSKEESLRQAKLEMLKTDFSNPFYWGAFVMYGN